MKTDKILLYAALGVGGYFAVTQGIPWLVKKLGEAGGKTGAAAAGAAAQTAGTTAGGIVTAAPKALSAAFKEVNDYANSDANALKPFGESVGGWLYDLFHPRTLIKTQVVNGKKFAVYSDGTSESIK